MGSGEAGEHEGGRGARRRRGYLTVFEVVEDGKNRASETEMGNERNESSIYGKWGNETIKTRERMCY